MKGKILQGIFAIIICLIVILGTNVSDTQEVFADERIKITVDDILWESNAYVNKRFEVDDNGITGETIITFKPGEYELDVAVASVAEVWKGSYIFVIPKGVSLTINDTSDDKKGEMSMPCELYVELGGKLIINGGNFPATYPISCINNNGTTVINNGQIARPMKNTGTLTINGGTIAGSSGIQNGSSLDKTGTLIINGGTIEGSDCAVAYFQGTQVNINGGIFKVDKDNGLGYLMIDSYSTDENINSRVASYSIDENINSRSALSVINPTSILNTELSEKVRYDEKLGYNCIGLYAETDTLIITAAGEENTTSDDIEESSEKDSGDSFIQNPSSDSANASNTIQDNMPSTSNTVQKDVSSPQTGDNFTYVMVVALLATIIIITIGKRKKVRC